MPNHCTHVVTVTGPSSELDAMEAGLKGAGERNYFDFNRVIPAPPYIIQKNLSRADEEAHPGRNWMDWNRRRWGTKWPAYHQVPPERVPEKLIYQFDTAWSYCAPILEELTELYPRAHIHVEAIDEGWNWSCIADYYPRENRGPLGVFFKDRKAVVREIECCRDDAEFLELHLRVKGTYPEPIEEETPAIEALAPQEDKA